MSLKYYFQVFCAICVCTLDAYNILITLPGIASSQSLVMHRLAEILGERGNNVTVLHLTIIPDVKGVQLQHAKEIKFDISDDQQLQQTVKSNADNAAWLPVESDEFPLKRFTPYFRTVARGCDKLLSDKTYLEQLRSYKFDVIVIFYFDFCSFGLAKALNIESTVYMSTAYMLDPFSWYSQSPATYSYVVSGVHDVTDKMNFLQRAKNTLLGVGFYVVFQYGIEWTYTDLFRKHFGPQFPSLNQLMGETQLFFVNSDPFFEYPRPISPHVIYIGGFTNQKAEKLDEKWLKILDESGDSGVVVFSLGSIANTKIMPNDTKLAFYNAFKRIPQTIIWRFEGTLPEEPIAQNIHMAKWLPQKDLLGHPKVKAFISHGGYNSLTEATYFGVPMILYPLFGDQFANCRRVEKLNVGVSLKKVGLTEDAVYKALTKVLNDSTVQENAHKLGRMIRNKPVSSHDLAVKWIEFLAEFKELNQLKPASQDLNFIQYFSLDVFGCIILVIVAVNLVLTKLICRLCCSRTKIHLKTQ